MSALCDDDGFYQLCERIGTQAVAARILLHCARYALELVDLSRLEEIRRVAMAPFEERKAKDRQKANLQHVGSSAPVGTNEAGRTAEKLAEKVGEWRGN